MLMYNIIEIEKVHLLIASKMPVTLRGSFSNIYYEKYACIVLMLSFQIIILKID